VAQVFVGQAAAGVGHAVAAGDLRGRGRHRFDEQTWITKGERNL